jgi:hypothetical protein
LDLVQLYLVGSAVAFPKSIEFWKDRRMWRCFTA